MHGSSEISSLHGLRQIVESSAGQQAVPPAENERKKRTDQGYAQDDATTTGPSTLSRRSPTTAHEKESSDSSHTMVCGSEEAIEME